MRSLVITFSLSLLAPAALADPAGPPSAPVAPAPVATARVDVKPPVAAGPSLTPIVVDDTPERCRPMIKRTMVPSPAQQLAARIAIAGCIADAKVAALSLIDGQESVLAIEEAVAPAIALLDNVLDAGDAPVKIMALRAKADLYTQMSAKMLGTVPAPATTTPEAAQLRETRRQIVEGMTQPWRDLGRASHQAIVDIGRAHPELVRNPVAQNTIRQSERQLAVPIATRE